MSKKCIKEAAGTAGEARQNSEYKRMVAYYGSEHAVRIILTPELEAAGESWEDFVTYRRFKEKVQTRKISFTRARDQAAAYARAVMEDEGFSFEADLAVPVPARVQRETSA